MTDSWAGNWTPSRVGYAIVGFGAEGYGTTEARRLKLLNALNFVAMVINITIGVWFLSAGWQVTWPIAFAVTIAAACLLITPFLHRVNDTAAAYYFCIFNAVAFVVFGHLEGSSAGSQYFMLAAPAVLLLFGTKRLAASAAMGALMVGVFCYVEFLVPARSILPEEFTTPTKVACVIGSAALVFGAIYYALRLGEDAEAALEQEYERSETLLLNLMPRSIAKRLKNKPTEIIADHFDAVTILFADIVDFTPRATKLSPRDLVKFLNRVFSEFDRLAEIRGLEKIKTIGDAYMVAGGMPEIMTGHAEAVAELALDMIEAMEKLGRELNDPLTVRIGIHTGPAVAGVIGTRKLFYDVWGDTVNTASRMESHGSSGMIQVTEDVRKVLGDQYVFESRGVVDVKGKGEMNLFYLVGRSVRT
jgi:adenylate cyclase